MRSIQTYRKLPTKYDTAKLEFKSILDLVAINEIVSYSLLIKKHGKELSGMFGTEHKAKIAIAKTLRQAHKLNIVQKCQTTVIPEYFTELKTVVFWQSQLRGSRLKNAPHNSNLPSTKKQYISHLWNFNKWLTTKTFTIKTLHGTSGNSFEQKEEKRKFENVEELMALLDVPFADPKNITHIIKQYLLDDVHKNKKASYMVIIKSSIVSYFEKNEQPIQLMFNPKTTHSVESEYEQSISLYEFLQLLTFGCLTITEKALFICKFQRGLDVSTLVDRFNYEAWEQLVEWFGSEKYNSWNLDKCPVPISLVRIKTDFKHVGFLDRDAVDALKEYLHHRESQTGENMKVGQPIFLNDKENAITPSWIFAHFTRIAKRAGIQKYVVVNGRRQYKMDSHELRDLLKSTLIDSGCRPDIADHVIGHKPRDSYEKQTTLYSETMSDEYSKASKRINVFTKTSRINGNPENKVMKDLEIKGLEMNNSKKEIMMDRVITKRNKLFAVRQIEIMQDMQKLIVQMKSASGETCGSREFRCVSCDTVHGGQECPVCGSQLKRIFEDI